MKCSNIYFFHLALIATTPARSQLVRKLKISLSAGFGAMGMMTGVFVGSWYVLIFEQALFEHRLSG